MALTPAQHNRTAMILGVTPSYLTAQITSLGTDYTVQVEADIVTELDRWETYGGEFTKLHPKESNKGVETFPEVLKGDIRKNLAILLGMVDTYFAESASMGTLQLG